MTDLDALKKALPKMSDLQLAQLRAAHRMDPYAIFEKERGDLIRDEINRRGTNEYSMKIDQIIREVLDA